LIDDVVVVRSRCQRKKNRPAYEVACGAIHATACEKNHVR